MKALARWYWKTPSWAMLVAGWILWSGMLLVGGCPGVQAGVDCARDADGKIH